MSEKVPETIPYDRFQGVVTEKNDLATKLAAAEKELSQWQQKGATADTLAKQLEAAKAETASLQQRYDLTRNLGAAGLADPEVQDLFAHKWQGLPEKDRPAIDQWVKGLTAEPAKAPVTLRPFLPQAAGATTTATTTAQAGAAQAAGATTTATASATRSPNASVQTPAATGQKRTAEQWAQMSTEEFAAAVRAEGGRGAALLGPAPSGGTSS